MPVAPLAIAVHLASVWVPFTSEAKEAVAHYDELLREMKLAVQEARGRSLPRICGRRRTQSATQRGEVFFERYIPEASQAFPDIPGVPKDKTEKSFLRGSSKLRSLHRRRSAEWGERRRHR